MAHRFKLGDIVKYISGVWGDAARNPLWGGEFGNIKGEVVDIDLLGADAIQVLWRNGTYNWYDGCDLEHVMPDNSLPDDLFEIR